MRLVIFIGLWAFSLSLLSCGADEISVTGLEPGIGVIRGGEKVTISGEGFDQDLPVNVFFGRDRAPYVSIKGSRTIHATTPEVESEGPVDVLVVTSDGTEFRISNAFEFVRHNRMAECVNIGRALNGHPPGEK